VVEQEGPQIADVIVKVGQLLFEMGKGDLVSKG
jgi:hypothetical protein